MRPSLTDAERQARFRARLRALATEPERLPSGNYRDICADCGQIMVAPSIAELDGTRCACPPSRHTSVSLVELVCLACARPVATLRAHTPGARVLLTRQPRCQVCGGAAVVSEVTEVRIPEPIQKWGRLKRGRPPKRAPGAGGMTPTPNGRPPASTRPVSPRPPLEVRMAALQAAATFAGGKALSTEVSTADVLKVAAAFERYLPDAQR